MVNPKVNRQIILISRPQGIPNKNNFTLREATIPEPKTGQLLIRSRFLSVDPYMRGLMNESSPYMVPFQLNEPLHGGGVGTVILSTTEEFKTGDIITGILDWADYSVVEAKNVRLVDDSLAPISTAVGVLGMPGMTAYFGLLDVGHPKAGETLVVSAAAGAVGMIVGQMERFKAAGL